MPITNKQLVDAYAEMVTDREAAGFKAYLITLMFDDIPGSAQRRTKVMAESTERLYATLLTRVVRNPRSVSHAWKCPTFIGCPDWPVAKHQRSSRQYILPNDGQHVHGMLMMPPVSRLKEPIDRHFHREEDRYLRSPLAMIDCQPVTSNAGEVMKYILKALLRNRVASDDLIVLPRALSELADLSQGQDGDRRMSSGLDDFEQAIRSRPQ